MFFTQDNSQKLYEVQCRLTGNHVIVQPGRVHLQLLIPVELYLTVNACNMFMYVFLGFVKGRDLDEALQERDAASNVLLSK